EVDALPMAQRRSRQELCDGAVESDRPFDAILLGYALCSNGTANLKAGSSPLVIPRAHDCISLLLGSRKRYQDYFDRHPGTYWYSSGWIETCLMPGKERYEQTLAYYARLYGEDNAQYLMDLQSDWYQAYHRAAYVDWGFPNREREQAFTRKCAADLGWEYDELQGDAGLLQRLVDGEWPEDEFLILQPGQISEADPAGAGILKTKSDATSPGLAGE
ncbi:MAG: DUF1638 domain-containing protein, partial [Verrucomicrobia bacterium]|nr:DUF1638 domain-containing protein [Verrucomicrobiota bacterium]